MEKVQKRYQYVGTGGEIRWSKWFFIKTIGDKEQLKGKLKNEYRTIKTN